MIMLSRMQRAADLMYHLEQLDVWLVLRGGQLTFSLGRDAPPVTKGIAKQVLELEPELRSIVGWEGPPEACPACGSDTFYERLDGSYGCAYCWPHAVLLPRGAVADEVPA